MASVGRVLPDPLLGTRTFLVSSRTLRQLRFQSVAQSRHWQCIASQAPPRRSCAVSAKRDGAEQASSDGTDQTKVCGVCSSHQNASQSDFAACFWARRPYIRPPQHSLVLPIAYQAHAPIASVNATLKGSFAAQSVKEGAQREAGSAALWPVRFLLERIRAQQLTPGARAPAAAVPTNMRPLPLQRGLRAAGSGGNGAPPRASGGETGPAAGGAHPPVSDEGDGSGAPVKDGRSMEQLREAADWQLQRANAMVGLTPWQPRPHQHVFSPSRCACQLIRPGSFCGVLMIL